MLLFVLGFLSLVLVESEWLVSLSTLIREFKMLRRRQQRQRQKNNRIRLCSHYLSIIPRARMGFESIAHEAEDRMGY